MEAKTETPAQAFSVTFVKLLLRTTFLRTSANCCF